jgi:hypothetical protein
VGVTRSFYPLIKYYSMFSCVLFLRSVFIFVSRRPLRRGFMWGMLGIAWLIGLSGCGYEDEHAALLDAPEPSVPIAQAPADVDKKWLRRLYSKDPQERAMAAGKLSEHEGDPEGVAPYLIDLLNDPVLFVREAAAEALIGHVSLEVRDALIAKVKEDGEDWAVRARAIKALGAMGNPTALEVIIDRRKDMSAHVRMAVVEALSSMEEEKATATLREMSESDANQRVRGLARDALSKNASR